MPSEKTPRARLASRIDLRAGPDLKARIGRQADRRSQTLSGYIRQAVADRLASDEAAEGRRDTAPTSAVQVVAPSDP